MPVNIESTTDTPEAVTAALGSLAKTETVEDSAPAVKAGETPEASEALENEELEAKTSEEEDESTEQSEDESESKDKPKKKGGFKKRIDKLTSKLSAKEQEIEYWKSEALKQKKTETQPAMQKTVTTDLSAKPNKDDFEKHEEYVEALAGWKAEQMFKEKEVKQKAAQMQSEAQQKHNQHMTRVQEFVKNHEDWDEVMEDANDIPLSNEVLKALSESDDSAALMYELAKNKEELKRISALPTYAAIREIGKFEAKFITTDSSAQEPKKVTKAPPPVKTVSSKGVAAAKNPDDMGFQEYKKWREQRI